MAVTNYYSFGGEILGEETSGVRRDYLTDALGSVTATVTEAGTVENTYRYKPYGETLAKIGAGSDPKFLWAGSGRCRQTNNKYCEIYDLGGHYGVNTGMFLPLIMPMQFHPPPLMPPPAHVAPVPVFGGQPGTGGPPRIVIRPPGGLNPVSPRPPVGGAYRPPTGPIRTAPVPGNTIIRPFPWIMPVILACGLLMALPAPAGPPLRRRRPNSCGDDLYDYYDGQVHLHCGNPHNTPGCSQNEKAKKRRPIPCDEMKKNVEKMRKCLKAREDFTDVCFKPPYGDNGHPEQEKGLKAGIGICDQRIKDEC